MNEVIYSCLLRPSASAADGSKDELLSAGGMTVQLQDADVWRSFCSAGTEMIVNRAGRYDLLFVRALRRALASHWGGKLQIMDSCLEWKLTR
jgi:hypothetical protein